MMCVVFDRWLTVSRRVARTYRVAVWRRVSRARREAGLWSARDRAAMRDEMRRLS